MGRKRKGISVAVSSGVIVTVTGIVLALAGAIIALSFIQLFKSEEGSGRFLFLINTYLWQTYGPVSVAIPFFLFTLAGFCFNSKNHTLIHWHTPAGTLFMMGSVAVLFGSGTAGATARAVLYDGFTAFGGGLILIVLFFIGLVIFFDIEPHVLVAWMRDFIAGLSPKAETSRKSVATDDDEFISDKKVDTTKAVQKVKKDEAVKSLSPEDTYIQDGKKSKSKHTEVQKPSNTLQVTPLSHAQAMMWVHPTLNLLQDTTSPADRGDTAANADIIENTLRSFGIKARVAEVNPGPTVTQYALEVAVGTNISEIVKKSSNLALALASTTGTVRIEAPIPGRALVGIEIPNKKPELVTIKRLLENKVFTENKDPLLVPLGLDVAGETQAISLSKMPHALIAGTTGSGKSVAINAWITTILMRTKPSDVRLILVDPKQVELTSYNGVPHLMTEVITDPSKVVNALRWAVAEMEARYKLLRQAGVRNLEGYNMVPDIEKKPYVVFVIDELADLMMVAKADIEGLIVRIAQKARAVGIHLVLATQRPSVNVITGLMKANIPTRLAFNVASGIDSKVILDTTGAENLVGKGDMFYSAPDTPRPRRIQGPFVSEKEVNVIVEFIKKHNPTVQYTEEVTEVPKDDFVGANGESMSGADRDSMFDEALELIRGLDTASASLFQRRLKVGYARAARILDELHDAGYVGPAEGAKPRKVLIQAKVEDTSSSMDMTNAQTLPDDKIE